MMTDKEIAEHPICINHIQLYGNAFYSPSFNSFYNPIKIEIKRCGVLDSLKYYFKGKEISDIKHISLKV